ncbi:MAG: DUF4190 domain-containing protein [Armatimonadetes bacterium]|nr:DUF4190 domain-containing protein [Armatimonadota bacterium]
MAKAACPNCGAEYDPSGIATMCSRCLKPLPAAAPPPAPAPAPAPPTPSSQRRPCIKCGELLYPTELTCWKCGSAQTARPGPVIAAPSIGPAGPPPVGVPPPIGAPPIAPPPPPSPYAGAAYAVGPSPEVQQRATWALVIGILSLFCCSIVLGPIAIWLGASARRDGAGGNATAGMVLGIIAVALCVIGGIIWVALLATAGQSGGSWTP